MSSYGTDFDISEIASPALEQGSGSCWVGIRQVER